MKTDFENDLRIPETTEELIEYFTLASDPLSQDRVLDLCYDQPKGWSQGLDMVSKIQGHTLIYQKVRPVMLSRLRGILTSTSFLN